MVNKDSKRPLIILIHEIYGVNDHIQHIGDLLRARGMEVIIPNLLEREAFSYMDEDQAYHNFMKYIGFSRAVDDIQSVIRANREKYEHIVLIGFSVGATIAWLCSTSEVDGVIGFYGSRIRDAVEINPSCPTLLFFSQGEKSFQVSALEPALRGKPNTHLEWIDANHGYMNPYGRHFDQAQYDYGLARSFAFLEEAIESSKIESIVNITPIQQHNKMRVIRSDEAWKS